MVFPSNNMPGMPPGMMPGGPMPMPRAPFPQPPMPLGMPPMFAGIPGANPFANRPMAMAIPGFPPGMAPMGGMPMPMSGPIDPFTGRPLNIGLNMGPAPMPMPMGLPQQSAGMEMPLVSMFNSLLGTLQSTQEPAQAENPLMTVFNTLMGSLSGLLGIPTTEDGTTGAQDATVISDSATALSTVLSESSDIAGADGDSGNVSTADLAMVARNKDGKYSADAQAAAQFLMANQAIWSAIDNLDKTADTKASIENLSKALSDPNILNATADNPPSATSTDTAEPIADPATALTSLIGEGEDVADADGDASSISVQDLVIVSQNKDDDFSPEAQAAAKFMLSNQGIWNEMDAMDDTEDTKVTLENLSKAISEPDILAATTDSSSATGEESTITDNATALDLLDQSFDDIAKYDDDATRISLLDLSRAARESKNKDLLAVVKYLQSNPDVFKQLAKKAGEDGDTDSVSEADIANALGDTDFMSTTQEEAAAQDPGNLTMKDILSTLNDYKSTLDTAATGANADNLIAKQDLQAIADNNDGKFNDKLVAAAKAALDNKDLMAALDTRGTFSFDDLQTFADAARTDENYVPPATTSFKDSQAAYTVLSKAISNGTLATGNFDKDGNFTGSLTDGSGKFVDTKTIKGIANGDIDAPYELREACKWIVNNPAELQKMEMYENMDGQDDDGLHVDLIQAVASGPVEENFGLDVGNQSVVSGEDKRKAKEIFSRNDNALLKKIDAIQGGNPDGVISNDDMLAAVKDRTGKFTVEEMRAILTVIGGNDGNVDGSIWDNINDGDEKASYEEFFRDIEQ